MLLVYKQLTKEIFHNKIFISLLLLLTTLTSLSFFFVRFSIDGNMAFLDTLSTLTQNQKLYMNALQSNTTLATTFLISLIGMTGFVYTMFFYRFFKTNKKQIGCLKALGFKDSMLRFFFMVFVAILSTIGALIGLIGGYFISSILIQANTKTYSMSSLVKGISPMSLLIGLAVATIVFCILTFASYSFVRGKEAGMMLANSSNQQSSSRMLKIANCIVRVIPIKNKFPLRIALRKPVALILIVVAVMGFSIFIIIGQSLNISSQKVFDSQTIGHNYAYDTQFTKYRLEKETQNNQMKYLDVPGTILINGKSIDQTITGLYEITDIFTLENDKGDVLQVPKNNTVYINPALADMYGVSIDETMQITIHDTEYDMVVEELAVNAKVTSVYVSADLITDAMEYPTGAYNGILSNEELSDGDSVITREQRIDDLNRAAVSNKTSANVNQYIGAITGCILIFLALYMNFQDNTKDILILHLMGYRIKAIRKMLIDVYRPIVWFSFIVTLLPSILYAQSIQKSLSISTNDYMPFGTSIFIILLVFISLNVIYLLVQGIFSLGIKKTIVKQEISNYINN